MRFYSAHTTIKSATDMIKLIEDKTNLRVIEYDIRYEDKQSKHPWKLYIEEVS